MVAAGVPISSTFRVSVQGQWQIRPAKGSEENSKHVERLRSLEFIL